MQVTKILLITFALCSLIFHRPTSWATASPEFYPPVSHPRAQQLFYRIDAALEKLFRGELDLPIWEIKKDFLSLPRQEISSSDLLETKYKLLHFHHILRKHLIEYFWVDANRYEWVLRNLLQLNLGLDEQDFQTLFKNRPRQLTPAQAKKINALTESLLRQRGAPALLGPYINLSVLGQHSYIGPRTTLKSTPPASSNLSFNPDYSWLQDPEFARYVFGKDGQMVYYRGLQLAPGDVLLIHSSTYDDGLFSAFSLPEKYLHHSAVVAFLQVEQRQVPVVLEMAGAGIRAVPLRDFLDPLMTRYLEVYRYQGQLPKDFIQKLSQLSHRVIYEEKGYNLLGPEGYPESLTCIEVIKYIYESLGVTTLREKSQLKGPYTVQNFAQLGLSSHQFLTPTDLAFDPQFKVVDLLNNDQFVDIISSGLLTEKFGEIVATRQLKNHEEELDLDDSLIFSLKIKSINTIQEDFAPFSKLFLFFSGLTNKSFPRGSAAFMAFVSALNDFSLMATQTSQEKLLPTVEMAVNQRFFSYASLKQNPRIRQLIDQNMASFARWFK